MAQYESFTPVAVAVFFSEFWCYCQGAVQQAAQWNCSSSPICVRYLIISCFKWLERWFLLHIVCFASC